MSSTLRWLVDGQHLAVCPNGGGRLDASHTCNQCGGRPLLALIDELIDQGHPSAAIARVTDHTLATE